MKYYKYCFAFFTLASVVFSSCKNDDINNEHHYDNQLYVSSVPVCDDLLIKPSIIESSREITYRLASPAVQDIEIHFDAIPSQTASYNLIYNDSAEALDSKFYNIPIKTTTIKTGDISSDNILIQFKNTNELDKSKRYVLPVTIISASHVNILQSARTAYFIFKGAALINVVANIEKMYFPINWKSNVNGLSTVTIEALVRSKDWTKGRNGTVLSTIFGIEGSFLVRIGDADRPGDQLQVVAPGGNFPQPNKVTGLPINEWVHVAIVYDNASKERIYYLNGIQVYKDNATNGSVDLGYNCYIGKSYDDDRWLPGEISEVRIWSIQRTAEQIAGNPYEVNPTSEGLIAYWKFNEGAGSTIHDHTEHGNDIVGTADPTWIPVEIPNIN